MKDGNVVTLDDNIFKQHMTYVDIFKQKKATYNNDESSSFSYYIRNINTAKRT